MANEQHMEDPEAHRVEEEIGLGGAGTEGKPGPSAGGREPQIPEDITDPLESEEALRKTAERLAKEFGVKLDE